jgi:putative endopeptidase
VEVRFDDGATDNRVYARVRLRGPHLPRALDRNRNRSDRLRDEQRVHWQRLAILSGVIAPEEVDAAMRINAWLAAAGRPDFKKGDRMPLLNRDGFAGRRFPWQAFFDGLEVPEGAPLRPADPNELARIDRLLELPIEDLKSFARVLLVEAASEYLDTAAVDEEGRFHDAVVPNTRLGHRSLANVCLRLTARDLESPLADAYLSDLADANAEALVRPLFDALRGHLARDIYLASWMDPATRGLAIRQVNAVRLRLIGDVEATPPDLSLADAGSFLDAHRRVRGAVMAKRLAELGTPPLEREVSPNFNIGRYSTLSNLVWLSPEIVRPPYVSGGDYNATTFGSLGTIIGHELSHAFARAPRAAPGPMSQKWSEAAAEGLRSRAACFARKFDSFIRAADEETARHSSGEDDLADIVGVQLALQALDVQAAAPRSQFGDHYRRDFFLTYAHTVCAFSGDNAAERDNLRDPHAPGRARINAVASNLPAFAEAFACLPETPMAPRDRCPVW